MYFERFIARELKVPHVLNLPIRIMTSELALVKGKAKTHNNGLLKGVLLNASPIRDNVTF